MTAAASGWVPLSPLYPPPTAHTGAAAIVPPSPPAVPPTDIRIGEGGYVHGIDAMLDQIARAAMPHAGAMLVKDVLPILQKDTALHTRVGQAAGAAIAERWQPWIVFGAAALGIVATVQAVRFFQGRGGAPSRTQRRGRRAPGR